MHFVADRSMAAGGLIPGGIDRIGEVRLAHLGVLDWMRLRAGESFGQAALERILAQDPSAPSRTGPELRAIAAPEIFYRAEASGDRHGEHR